MGEILKKKDAEGLELHGNDQDTLIRTVMGFCVSIKKY